MTTRYRVEYALKSHRRDGFIEWIKGLTATPFVLHAGSGNHFRRGDDSKSASDARGRYAEIFRDVEQLIADHITLQSTSYPYDSRLKQLIPSIGHFFTVLPLERAFYVIDEKRGISRRRMVAPSFNDIRLILNTAQVMALAQSTNQVQLVTFDGDVTLYEDGCSINDADPIVERLLGLLRRGIYIGVVTAAGYSDLSGAMYHERLGGLIRAIMEDHALSIEERSNLLIMGGECNYLFRLNGETGKLDYIERERWALSEMLEWSDEDRTELLDRSEKLLKYEINKLSLVSRARIVRKESAVGVVPLPGKSIPREALEEIVLNAQHALQSTEVAKRVYFCAFNGGSDVWVDIGDKRYGVLCLQRCLGGIPSSRTLHVGDQFASIGANDFKARLAACTVWIANPTETEEIIDELIEYIDESARR